MLKNLIIYAHGLKKRKILKRKWSFYTGLYWLTLKATAERINALIASPESKEKADKCRILSINEKLQTVILDAGTANGVNTGLIWRVTTRSGRQARLKVIAARPFICAATVLEGEFSSLAPGMLVSIGDN